MNTSYVALWWANINSWPSPFFFFFLQQLAPCHGTRWWNTSTATTTSHQADHHWWTIVRFVDIQHQARVSLMEHILCSIVVGQHRQLTTAGVICFVYFSHQARSCWCYLSHILCHTTITSLVSSAFVYLSTPCHVSLVGCLLCNTTVTGAPIRLTITGVTCYCLFFYTRPGSHWWDASYALPPESTLSFT